MGDLDRAFATFAELEQLDLKPDTGTYNALLHTCVNTRETASGRRLLNRMEIDGVAPDAMTFMHRASLLVMSRQSEAAYELMATCRQAGFTPHTKMFMTVINYLLRQQRLDEAAALYKEMEEDRVYIYPGFRSKVEAALGISNDTERP